MRDVQTQLPITLAPVPAEICSHIITDKQWLMENVLCLLSNAVRYSQAGSVEVRLVFQSGTSTTKSSEQIGAASSICIEVWDSGIGLPESVMDTLFAPFKQAQRLAGGTGLGLFSLAKRVEALHGQYGVCKRPDKLPGSMFWFSIPYRPDDLSSAAANHPGTDHFGAITAATSIQAMSTLSPEASLRAGVLSREACQTYCVLVVDDAPSILKMTTMLLTKKGHAVEKAVNGAQAVDMVVPQIHSDDSVRRYDVVLMDLQMPVMDGPEAIRRIRAAERKAVADGGDRAGDLESGGKAWQYQARPRRQLIIALSANSDSDTMQEALDAGADHFMSKPFTYDTFCDLMLKNFTSDSAGMRGTFVNCGADI
jgi:CheY-like chemotaxis protein